MEARRPTQSDIAKLVGVHRATVSLAFKNHPSIPERTKTKIRQCAEKLGYSPDPMLSSLAAYRSRNRPKAFQGIIGWLTHDIDMAKDSITYMFRDVYAGASSRAKSHGFHVEAFDLEQPGKSRARVASILRARNVSGILLPPQHRPNMEICDFPWHQFSALAYGYSLIKPQLHSIASTQFRAMVKTMRQVRSLGYKRIGFFFQAVHDERTDHNYLSGYLVETYSHNRAEYIPPLLDAQSQPKVFKKWYDKYRPEVIVTGDRGILGLLDSFSIGVPSEVGVACLLVTEHNDRLSGIYEDGFHIGEVAIDFLVAMIHRGERGVPDRPQRVLVEGVWNPGQTLRQH